jgi:eukaryotic-like serine/threonine-protein kinase
LLVPTVRLRALGNLAVLLCLFSLPACGGGGSFAPSTSASALAAAATPTPIPTPVVANSDWPTYQHDIVRTGIQASSPVTSTNVSSLTLNWTFTSSTGFMSSPVVYDGTVYVVDHNGLMTALDASTGNIVWQQELGQYIEQTPAVYDNMLFVGEHNIPSQLWAINPQNGGVIWDTVVPGGLKGSPVAIGGTLYEGIMLGDPGFCAPGGIYAFNEQTGAQGTSWLTDPGATADGGGVWSPITYDGQRLYYGTGNTCTRSPSTANAIIGMDPTTLQPDWSVQTADPLTDDDVGAGVAISGNQGFVPAKNGNLYDFNLATGAINWQVNVGSSTGYGPIATPTIVNSTIVVSAGVTNYVHGAADEPGALLAYNMSGQKQWSVPTVQTEVRSVASTGNVILAGLDNNFTALSVQNGSTLWSFQTQGLLYASPAVTNQGVYVADENGIVYAFGLPNQISTSARARASRLAYRTAKGRVAARFSERPLSCLH